MRRHPPRLSFRRLPFPPCLKQLHDLLLLHETPFREFVHDEMFYILVMVASLVSELFETLMYITHAQIAQAQVELLVGENIHV